MTTKNTKYSSRNKFEKPFVRKACLLCKIDFLDYKNIGLLKKYISDRGKIESAGRTGTCAKCQRSLTVAIKRARHMALLPLSANHSLNTKVVIYKQDKIEKADQVKIEKPNENVDTKNRDLEEKDQKVKAEKDVTSDSDQKVKAEKDVASDSDQKVKAEKDVTSDSDQEVKAEKDVTSDSEK
ncbi:MAG: 30S ribosomal protein S18 [Chloroflexi bacterium]|nr:30S ribosomal protein S18 [Chloroflexota bacterium]|tara:strand:- start:13 stop:558 length:546 start_codon:yes stop_codon:yes gene_type:complete